MRILKGEIIPLLRRQKGFEDEISFIAPERNQALAISLWEERRRGGLIARRHIQGS